MTLRCYSAAAAYRGAGESSMYSLCHTENDRSAQRIPSRLRWRVMCSSKNRPTADGSK